jgi:hypothetical protein
MSQRFSYIQYDPQSVEIQQIFKSMFENIEEFADEALPGPSRSKSLLMTALEEAYMWTGKAVRDAQIARTGIVTEQKTRSDE